MEESGEEATCFLARLNVIDYAQSKACYLPEFTHISRGR